MFERSLKLTIFIEFLGLCLVEVPSIFSIWPKFSLK